METANHALLRFDGTCLLLPQDDVTTIEMTTSIDFASRADGAMGMLRVERGEWPAYALNANLEPQAECPEDYKFCAVISGAQQVSFSIACEEVGAVPVGNDNLPQPLQDCMRLPGAPIESLLLRDGELLLVGDAGALCRYLLGEAA